MKVYFEEDGYGGCEISLNVYVSPRQNGSAYHFGVDGTKELFYWADPGEAVVFDHKELPEELWYSISHGVHEVTIPEDKSENWTLEDIKYDVLNHEKIDAYIEASKKIKEVTTVEDFKKLYPIIKKSGFISNGFVDKLFSLCNVPRIPVWNGENGIAFYQEELIYRSLLFNLGLEESPEKDK